VELRPKRRGELGLDPRVPNTGGERELRDFGEKKRKGKGLLSNFIEE